MSSTVFVCGATGTQGGALIDHLLKSDIKVHAITRSLNSPAAQRLQKLGISIAEGDFDNDESVKRNMTNCTSLFLNLMPKLTDLNSSLEQARHLLKIAKELGIKQVIYTSGVSANNPSQNKYWEPKGIISQMMLNKQAIENEIRNAGFETWTILRPGNFMTNFLFPMNQMYPGLAAGTFTTALTSDTVLPMVDPNDIGRFAAAAILEPVRFNQQEIEIASEFMGAEEIMRALSRATGKDFKAVFMSDEEIDQQRGVNPFVAGQLMMRGMSSFVDLEKVKAWGLPLGTFDQFLIREKARVDTSYP
ncbi:hypothetical protein N7491_000174 [Penicillium cf. griseofulvum]|uniref:NmrA-like domain-containing protein n=1 Tax=Penicillium cf. griseofulvum TaxID=2972120 RepID=A0A9W9MEX2_9EURO|nr:hypothetical protein N7472_004473 [Penicillium cf. griseofulvum]KAJ5442036.1 hypothetical protein N7445_005043 [Penicillium cf. griseofulvum]KAJ5450992.1 hypothetical protein N7491_000174 [Penicillium cf. griseofulvum]